MERHIVAILQQRVGPTSTGLGLIQPLADAFKLLTKEPTRPYKAFAFLLMPVATVFYIKHLNQYNGPRDLLTQQCLMITTAFVITIFSLFCLTKIIDFLFDLDKK